MESSTPEAFVNIALDVCRRFVLGQQLTNPQHDRQNRSAAFRIPTSWVNGIVSVLQAVTIDHAIETVAARANFVVTVLRESEDGRIFAQMDRRGLKRQFDFLFAIN